jgi:predicted flavoprotein YhiN
MIGGLYFCGEVMDIDADTGGYNFAGGIFHGVCGG